VTAITNSTGTVVQKYDYDAFGNILTEQDANFENPYVLTSRERDKESGLYFYRARYLDPRMGRFLSVDPSHYPHPIVDSPVANGVPYVFPALLALPQELNGYVYVLNDPLLWTDPYGTLRMPCDWNLFLAGTAVVATGIVKTTIGVVLIGSAGAEATAIVDIPFVVHQAGLGLTAVITGGAEMGGGVYMIYNSF